MMRALWLLLAALALLPGYTMAQAVTNAVVLPGGCGTGAYTQGVNTPTMDPQGRLCTALGPFTATGSTTARTPADRAADVANVLDSSALADGTSDNSAAFATALGKSKRVYVPAGTYGFTTKFAIPAGVSEIACDRGATFKALAGNATNALFFTADGTVTRLTVTGCKFDGNSANVGVNTLFTQAFQSSSVVFDNCWFTDNRWHMLAFPQATNSGVRNSRFDNVGNFGKGTGSYPLAVTVSYATSGTNNFFENNLMTNIGGDPFDAFTQVGFSAIGNKIIGDNTGFVHQTSGAGTGMYLFGFSPGSTFSDNYVTGMTGNGIDLNCVSGIAVKGNVSSHNGGAGISLSSNGVGDAVPCASMQGVTVGINTISNNLQAVAGLVTIATNGTTTAGSPVLNFASTTGVVDGYFIFDASLGIPVGSKVLSHTSTTVTATANAVGSGVASAASIQFLNSYPRTPAPNAGIWLGCVTGACAMDSFAIAGNVINDTQTPATQAYGIFKTSSPLNTMTNLKISADNVITGNVTASLFGVLLMEQGAGSNAWACSPGSGVAASGAFGSMACGFSATASGTGARAMGTSVTASGLLSDVAGSGVNDFGRAGYQGYGSGNIATSGDAQTGVSVLRGTTAGAAAVRATSNNGAASATNCINLPNNKTASLIITLNAFDTTTVTKGYAAVWGGGSVAPHLLTRGANAASTLIDGVGTAIVADAARSNGTVTGIASSITADTTNGCINASFTPPTSNTDTWHFVWRVETVEVQ